MSSKGDPATVTALVVSGVALGASLALLGLRHFAPPVHAAPHDHTHGVLRKKTSLLYAHGHDEEEDEHDEAHHRGRSKRSVAMVDDHGHFEHWRAGFTMKEARDAAEEAGKEAARKTPSQVLEDLQKGNARFWTGSSHRPDKNAFQRRALIAKQFPTTAVLGCADSRVPVEIVFDQGLGDLFVVRVAGNCLDTTTMASLQYAVAHLKVKVLLVMGHEGCGAIKAAQLPAAAIAAEPERLGHLLSDLKNGLDCQHLQQVQDPRARDREAVCTNVKKQVEKLLEDETIMSKVRAGELIIAGAFYEISSGIVDFFHEVSEAPDEAIARAPSKGVMSRCNSRVGFADK